jgi:Tol biopolymer transport system component
MRAPSPEILYGAPAVSDARLSPDGRSLAYLAPLDGVPNLWISALDGSSARAVTAESRPLTAPTWTKDGAALLFLCDGGGDELHHLWRVDLATGALTDLTPYDGVQAQLVGLSSS